MNSDLKQRGQTALIALLTIGVIVLVLGVSVAARGSIAALAGRRTVQAQDAFYAAQAGLDDALEKIARDKDFTTTGSDECTGGAGTEYLLTVTANASTCVYVTGASSKTIESRAISGSVTKSLRMTITVSTSDATLGQITIDSWLEI